MVKSTDVYKFTLIACGYASINILKNYGEACTARSHKFCGLTFLIFIFLFLSKSAALRVVGKKTSQCP